MENGQTRQPPEWIFNLSFAVSMLAFLAWILWYTLTQTTAGYR